MVGRSSASFWCDEFRLPFRGFFRAVRFREGNLPLPKLTRWNKRKTSALTCFFFFGWVVQKQAMPSSNSPDQKPSKELLGQGQRPDVIDSSGASALCDACKEGHEVGHDWLNTWKGVESGSFLMPIFCGCYIIPSTKSFEASQLEGDGPIAARCVGRCWRSTWGVGNHQMIRRGRCNEEVGS